MVIKLSVAKIGSYGRTFRPGYIRYGMAVIQKSYNFGRYRVNQKVTPVRGHRGKSDWWARPGTSARDNDKISGYKRPQDHGGLTHRVDVVEGGSLNHLTQSYFVLCSLIRGGWRCRQPCYNYL